MEDRPSFYAIIPANVRYDKELTPNAKLLYGEITALCNKNGYCWASNKYFAELYKVSNTSVSKWINQLINKNYLNVSIKYKPNSKEIDRRYLSLVLHPIEEKLNTPIKEKFIDNNTSINNTSNILLSEIKISDSLATEYFVIANAFRNLFIKNSKEQGLVNLKDLENAKYHKWTNEVRLIIENDKVNIDILRDIHDFLSSNTEQAIFWKPNVRSISKLRLQINKLIIAMNKDKAKQKVIKKQNAFTA